MQKRNNQPQASAYAPELAKGRTIGQRDHGETDCADDSSPAGQRNRRIIGGDLDGNHTTGHQWQNRDECSTLR
jgi:hypothetical protein